MTRPLPPSDCVANPVEVITIGETMVMFVPPGPGPLAEASALSIHVGGAESNVAMYLTQLGHRTQWVSRVGDDPFGDMVLRHLELAGVDTSAVTRVVGGQTGMYVKEIHSSRTVVHYYREHAAAKGLSPAVLADVRLADCPIMHLTGITAALSESAQQLIVAATQGRGDSTPLVSFDVNYRPKLWPAETAAPLLADLANASDLVFVGLDEARSLWGCTCAAHVRETLSKPETLVVKDGAIGAHSFGPDGELFVPTPRVTVVEPVGAGDAFAAGYLAALLDGDSEEARLRLGHLIAAAALGVRSDHAALPDRAWLLGLQRISAPTWSRLDLSGGL